MKKLHVKTGILMVGIVGSFAFFACQGAETAKITADEQPVDLTAKPVSESHGDPITTEKFDETIKGKKLTMVDFYTTWCGPCKMMAPHVKKLAAENADMVNVMQIDAEAQVEIAGRYNIRAYPTLLFFKKGQIVHTIEGAQSYEQLLDEVKRLK
ncbi:MAG: thioredoxin [Bacteroidia bacterium]|jgi:thioredoxin 1